jgi:hypothetical protein
VIVLVLLTSYLRHTTEPRAFASLSPIKWPQNAIGRPKKTKNPCLQHTAACKSCLDQIQRAWRAFGHRECTVVLDVLGFPEEWKPLTALNLARLSLDYIPEREKGWRHVEAVTVIHHITAISMGRFYIPIYAESLCAVCCDCAGLDHSCPCLLPVCPLPHLDI